MHSKTFRICLETKSRPCFFSYCSRDSIAKILGKAKVKLDLLINIDMLIMVEKCIRDEICCAVERYREAKNKYLNEYNKNKESAYLTF